MRTCIIDSWINFILLISLVIANHSREMHQRRSYNQRRIIQVEIERTEELLSKLIPLHVIYGIKNDQRVVDQIHNVTFLYSRIVNFNEFSKNSSA